MSDTGRETTVLDPELPDEIEINTRIFIEAPAVGLVGFESEATIEPNESRKIGLNDRTPLPVSFIVPKNIALVTVETDQWELFTDTNVPPDIFFGFEELEICVEEFP